MAADVKACACGYRDNMRLKGEKLYDTAALTKAKKSIADLEGKLAWHSRHSSELQAKVAEHAAITARSINELDEAKDKMKHLETVGFVMTERATRFEDEVAPRRAEVAKLAQARGLQDKDVARALRLVASLKQSLAQKEATIRCGACCISFALPCVARHGAHCALSLIHI